ncbi:conserved hypothetical protein [Staphylococcus capitis]|nr:conserved hypothetical protein [Staphylococcus capitis]
MYTMKPTKMPNNKATTTLTIIGNLNTICNTTPMIIATIIAIKDILLSLDESIYFTPNITYYSMSLHFEKITIRRSF